MAIKVHLIIEEDSAHVVKVQNLRARRKICVLKVEVVKIFNLVVLLIDVRIRDI